MMPILDGRIVAALGIAAMVTSAQAQQPPPPQAPPPPAHPAIEQGALDRLKATSERLAGAKSMSFTAVTTYESPARNGQPLYYSVLSAVEMQRPNKLRVTTPGDGPASDFYYDGKTMMAFEPTANLVAMADAPPTIDAALKAAYDTAAIYFPFTDVIVADPYKDVADGVKYAFYIGQSRVGGGTTTDMVAIVNTWVFEQIWIGADDKLPRKVRAVFLADPARLRHDMELSNWQLDPPIPADAFASSSATSATRIAFNRPDLKLPPGLKPPVPGKPATSR